MASARPLPSRDRAAFESTHPAAPIDGMHTANGMRRIVDGNAFDGPHRRVRKTSRSWRYALLIVAALCIAVYRTFTSNWGTRMDASSTKSVRQPVAPMATKASPWLPVPPRRAQRDDAGAARAPCSDISGMRHLISEAYAAGLQQQEPVTWIAGAKVGFMCGGLVGMAVAAAIMTFAFRLGLQA